jgi:hypothetical protein
LVVGVGYTWEGTAAVLLYEPNVFQAETIPQSSIYESLYRGLHTFIWCQRLNWAPLKMCIKPHSCMYRITFVLGGPRKEHWWAACGPQAADCASLVWTVSLKYTLSNESRWRMLCIFSVDPPVVLQISPKELHVLIGRCFIQVLQVTAGMPWSRPRSSLMSFRFTIYITIYVTLR